MNTSGERTKYLVVLVLALTLGGLASWGALKGASRSQRRSSSPSQPAQPERARVSEAFGKLPLYFIENRGQFDERVAYYLQGSDKTVYFTAEGLTFALNGRGEGEGEAETSTPGAALRTASFSGEPAADATQQRYILKLDFVGANPKVRPRGREQSEAVFSYFKGSREEWQSGLKSYSRIIYPDLWPGIDLVYAGTVNRMKYSFVVKAGADPGQIKLGYRGASEVKVNEGGELEVKTPVSSLSDERPVSYQGEEGERVEVATAYQLEAGEGVYGFEVGEYDRSRELVIDPAVLVYCGYIGGSGEDNSFGIAVDSAGNSYVTGSTSSSEASFPVTVGPDLTFTGGVGEFGNRLGDAFVAKVNPAGTALLYCGYIGGRGDDAGFDIKIDSEGNAYITGYTLSLESSFPVTVGPDQIHNGTTDAFVAKINASGTALLYCGYIGGETIDWGLSIAVDGVGNAYVTGFTRSPERSFPVKGGPDLTYNGGPSDSLFGDAFVAKVNAAGTALVYCGYIGGSDVDVAAGIALDSAGNAYIAGATSSTEASFPVKVGPDLTYNGGLPSSFFGDAFVARVNAAGTALIYCGYIGGTGAESLSGVTVDSAGNAYFAGVTSSTEASFPVTVGPDLSYNGGTSDAFVAKLNAAGTALIYCGYLGGSSSESLSGIAVDSMGNAYVTGQTSSTEASFPVTVGPDLSYNGGTFDAFVAKLNGAGTALRYCGFIGGGADDQAFKIAVDSMGNAYVTGVTGSTEPGFPVTRGPDLSYNGGSRDSFVAKISEALLANVSAASFSGASLATESIVAAFSANLATTTQPAATIPLPTSLAGTTVMVKDADATERLAPLFFVSPNQVNYQIPPETTAGPAVVEITSGDGSVSIGTVNIAAVAPGLFAANANGQGVAAAVALRVRGDGSEQYEPVARFDATVNPPRFVSVPLDLGPETDRVFLILYGTGIRFHSGMTAVRARIGLTEVRVEYAGPAPGFIGLDQVNVLLERELMGRGEVDVALEFDGQTANNVRVNIR